MCSLDFGEIACNKYPVLLLLLLLLLLRREDEYVGKRVMGMEVPGKRRRGTSKRRWLDSIRNDLSERELSG